mmetsp:Transcript_23345/g.50789  ORF Transcript_23345/g.50789 Transcript_23345/m.50789 type:complete len:114 (-) Transcript_23345:4-345(-)
MAAGTSTVSSIRVQAELIVLVNLEEIMKMERNQLDATAYDTTSTDIGGKAISCSENTNQNETYSSIASIDGCQDDPPPQQTRSEAEQLQGGGAVLLPPRHEVKVKSCAERISG